MLSRGPKSGRRTADRSHHAPRDGFPHAEREVYDENRRVILWPRLRAQVGRLYQEVALLREEIRIQDARMGRVAPQRRPHYPPPPRMAILGLRAHGARREPSARPIRLTGHVAVRARRITCQEANR